MNAVQPIVDEALALQNAGGNAELAQELFQMLQQELPHYLEKLPQIHQAGDLESLYQQVHKLHGSATYCGVPALKQAALSFESHLKQQQTQHYADDLAHILEQIEELLKFPSLPLSK